MSTLDVDLEIPVEGGRDERVLAERRLMAAILEDALLCYRAHLNTANVRRRKLFRDAERWILADDYWLFSFRNVCDILGIDPEAVRGELRRWRRRQFLDLSDLRTAQNVA